ncbi:nuclear transport factor 2 family protein [Vallicoccus soli]|uniref:DUF4440 domain-containing protein n=1 Tax=Vallicoccus soli TaxID=2339232 RepID=A0A3A3Z3I4_9ACTN|nr:nuclear transport factor 2 family protein [Vallicoccus soli]RJK97493.1 DUF4440 domain-containing protein [Vallicoccus soli]
MEQGPAHDEVAGLVDRARRAAVAYLGGDLREYARLLPHAEGSSLFPPDGGGAVRGFDLSDEHVRATAEYFRGGEADLEVHAAHTSRDVVVLVAVERQRGLVGPFPEQDWSLRVTLVLRRAGAGWELVHRHADALVHRVGMDQLAAMARGDLGGAPPPA